MGSIVQDKYEKGCYYVDGQTWQVGTRYTLLKVLGCGSFSSVVAALDNDTGEKVALKRIPDVLTNAENAKRVLREVCILRRLSHPHIIRLKDVFLKPSSTGRYMYKGGKLVPTSLDLYLALEYCDQGDLFHMRGQLSEAEVKVIMLQLLSAVQYLHRHGVWHRDIKSANILMTYAGGQRHIKLADLGSARSVLLEKRLRGSGGPNSSSTVNHHNNSHHSYHHLPHPTYGRCSFDGGLQQQQQQQGGPVSVETQTSASLSTGAGGDASPTKQRGSGCGVLGQRGQQGLGVGHSRQGSMDSIGSGDQQQQQHRQHEGGSILDQQPRQQQGSRVVFEGAGGDPQQQQQQKQRRLAPSGPPVHHSDSFLMDSRSSPSDIYARPVAGGGGGFKAPLTRMVCTPCYRAPEVVMSRGGYTESIDMWGCGCVFGELLQRVAWIGKATTPQLQVAPVFAIHGLPMTPTSGERFDGPGNSVTRTELAALFAVIGTPSWRCIESVANPAWRRYLRKITGRAPTLFRRFGSAGEVAVDLLARLLSFDPVRRCCSEEAIGHEYFEDIVKEVSSSIASLAAALMRLSSSGDLTAALEAEAGIAAAAAAAAAGAGAGTAAGVSGCAIEAELGRQQQQLEDEEMEDWEAFRLDEDITKQQRQLQNSLLSKQQLLEQQQEQQQQQQQSNVLKRPRDQSLSGSLTNMDPGCPDLVAAAAAGLTDAAAGDAMDEDSQQQQQQPAAAAAAALPPLPPAHKAPSGGSGGGRQQQQQQQAVVGLSPGGQHYYELDDPAAALAALEHDMAALMTELDAQEDTAPGGPPPQAPQLLRELLEREVAEHISHLQNLQTRHKEAAAAATLRQGVGVTPSPPGSPLLTPVLKRPTSAQGSSIRNQWQHLQPDPGPSMDPSRIGYQRVPHHADAEQAHLDPQQHLRAGRHGEWMAETLQAAANRTPGGNVWGVSLLPTGMSEESHPELADIIRHQNKR